MGQSAQALEEGNSLDRTVFSVLIILAIGVLVSRSFNWVSFFTRNLALTAFLSFALVSFLWSDFPFVALKRWFRDFGNYVMVLVALSDPRPLDAVRMVLRRLAYLLLPLSILLIKYYPEMGKQYDSWTGVSMFAGATTSKNMLGVVCMISGVFFFWEFVMLWPDRKMGRTRQIILVDIIFFAMALWLINLSNSATSRVCLALGCMVILAANSKWFRRHPGLLKAMVPTFFCLYLLFAFGLDMNSALAGAVGRDATLTDRTKIWSYVLGMNTNPLLGTGYESFWMGSRLAEFWENSGLGKINEAHNGYLEIYLNLGLIGLFLLVGFLVASYRTICRRLKSSSSFVPLSLALWTIAVLYSVTEAGFRSGPMWLAFLLGNIAIPRSTEHRVYRLAPFKRRAVEEVSGLPSGTSDLGR